MHDDGNYLISDSKTKQKRGGEMSASKRKRPCVDGGEHGSEEEVEFTLPSSSWQTLFKRENEHQFHIVTGDSLEEPVLFFQTLDLFADSNESNYYKLLFGYSQATLYQLWTETVRSNDVPMFLRLVLTTVIDNDNQNLVKEVFGLAVELQRVIMVDIMVNKVYHMKELKGKRFMSVYPSPVSLYDTLAPGKKVTKALKIADILVKAFNTSTSSRVLFSEWNKTVPRLLSAMTRALTREDLKPLLKTLVPELFRGDRLLSSSQLMMLLEPGSSCHVSDLEWLRFMMMHCTNHRELVMYHHDVICAANRVSPSTIRLFYEMFPVHQLPAREYNAWLLLALKSNRFLRKEPLLLCLENIPSMTHDACKYALLRGLLSPLTRLHIRPHEDFAPFVLLSGSEECFRWFEHAIPFRLGHVLSCFNLLPQMRGVSIKNSNSTPLELVFKRVVCASNAVILNRDLVLLLQSRGGDRFVKVACLHVWSLALQTTIHRRPDASRSEAMKQAMQQVQQEGHGWWELEVIEYSFQTLLDFAFPFLYYYFEKGKVFKLFPESSSELWRRLKRSVRDRELMIKETFERFGAMTEDEIERNDIVNNILGDRHDRELQVSLMLI